MIQFVKCILLSWPLHSYSGKVLKIITSSNKRSHTSPNLYSMIFILATSTPVMEESTKLIACLSEPSSWLIHCIAHPSKEEISAKWTPPVSFASRSTVLHCATIISAKGLFPSTSTCLGCKTLLNHQPSSQLLSPADYTLAYLIYLGWYPICGLQISQLIFAGILYAPCGHIW